MKEDNHEEKNEQKGRIFFLILRLIVIYFRKKFLFLHRNEKERGIQSTSLSGFLKTSVYKFYYKTLKIKQND
ncbi:hypothetical protein [uncultured Bacteroides sp.]|uniref:hypothetical protein n=1 Tax=uncultured Bacteroides sp. TaxID=162156 RepID=UPI0026246A12|nr:hypothetical protein [uncultured Bacteroides sp.]